MLTQVPQKVMDEMCQLTKNNSIEGGKASEVAIVYTFCHNLDKRLDMDTGTVGFKDDKAVRKVRNVKRDRAVVNALEKTKKEEYPELKLLKEQRLENEKIKNRKRIAQDKEKAKIEARDREEQRKLKCYDTLFSDPTLVDEAPKVDGSIEQCREA